MLKRAVLIFMWLISCHLCMSETIPYGNGKLRVTGIDNNAFRIQYIEQNLLDLQELIYTNQKSIKLRQSLDGNKIVFTLPSGCRLTVDSSTLTVSASDIGGRTVFTATEHMLRPSKAQDIDCYEATLVAQSPSDEHLYGLGQFQDGHTNLRGLSRRLTQVNTQISIPMYLSSKGYALLWNNYGMTEFNPPTESVKLVRESDSGTVETVNVTTTTGGREEHRESNRFSAEIDVAQDGMYSFLLDVGRVMSRRQELYIDGDKVVDAHNLWLPPTTSVLVSLKAGRHVISAVLEKDDIPVVYYSAVEAKTTMRSPVANSVDYTLFIGTADEAISSYRRVSGASPLIPKWALGYIHCRERFHNQDELLETARRFRSEAIPIDVIVQDWQWWGQNGWNSMEFDSSLYPDPKQMVDELHGMDIRLMLSVWSKIDKNSELGRQMSANGFYIGDSEWIDFFNPDGARAYWDNFSRRLLQPYGIDCWWQDATEPENDDLVGRRVNGGKEAGDIYRNVYPLLVNKTVYEGFRHDCPERRSMILTRSGYPGIQRYSAAMWSGDVGNDYLTLRRQIQGGLGMQSCGLPWWTYDAGGFFRPSNQYNDPEYIERMLRWIEVSVYLPLMRVHGYMSNTEPWNYGEEAQRIITDCIRERYQLMPYIYSNAAMVSLEGSTLMRPFIFDFSDDNEALNQECEYMFGESLLVNPVTEAGQTSWSTYLPISEGGWWDFRNGEHYEGGQTVSTKVDKSLIPVFARGGSIIPLGRAVQSTSESQSDSITLLVYPGHDAHFRLYEDEELNYNYERGKYSVIDFFWDDSSGTLTIGKRKGGYRGMLKRRTFILRFIDGEALTVDYRGKEIRARKRV